jgi:hypothetical protein
MAIFNSYVKLPEGNQCSVLRCPKLIHSHVPEKIQLRLLTQHANGTLPFVDDVPTVNIRIIRI